MVTTHIHHSNISLESLPIFTYRNSTPTTLTTYSPTQLWSLPTSLRSQSSLSSSPPRKFNPRRSRPRISPVNTHISRPLRATSTRALLLLDTLQDSEKARGSSEETNSKRLRLTNGLITPQVLSTLTVSQSIKVSSDGPELILIFTMTHSRPSRRLLKLLTPTCKERSI